jgi:hypothetical protein
LKYSQQVLPRFSEHGVKQAQSSAAEMDEWTARELTSIPSKPYP